MIFDHLEGGRDTKRSDFGDYDGSSEPVGCLRLRELLLRCEVAGMRSGRTSGTSAGVANPSDLSVSGSFSSLRYEVAGMRGVRTSGTSAGVANPTDVFVSGKLVFSAEETREMWLISPSHTERRRKKKIRRRVDDSDEDSSDGQVLRRHVGEYFFTYFLTFLGGSSIPDDPSSVPFTVPFR